MEAVVVVVRLAYVLTSRVRRWSDGSARGERYRRVGLPLKESMRVMNWLINALGLADSSVALRLLGEFMYALNL